MTTIRFTTKVGIVLTDITSIVLCDPAGIYGIKRNDNDSVVVSANTSIPKISAGTYEYDFTEPAGGIRYTTWVKWIYKGHTNYYEIVYRAKADVTEEGLITSPASVLAHYLIEDLSLFGNPDAAGDWPLYLFSLPDGKDVKSDCAALYDTPAVVEGKLMVGETIQHFGLQLRVRSQNYVDGWEKIASIPNILDKVAGVEVEINGVTYEIQNISRSSSAIYIGPDERRRSHFTVNFLMSMKMV